MPSNKKQHWLPQFYLRNFGNGECVSLFNIRSGRHIDGAPVRGQCQKSYLHGKNKAVERRLGELETKAGATISKLIQPDPILNISLIEMLELFRFIAYQWARTPAAGAEAEEQMSRFYQMAIKSNPKMQDTMGTVPAESIRMKHDNPVIFSLSMMDDMFQAIGDLYPKLLINDTNLEFIAADAPIVLYNLWCYDVTCFGTIGLASAGLMIFLPLSPRRCLILFDENIYNVGKINSPVVKISRIQDVVGLNNLQFLAAQENVYYSGDNGTKDHISSMPIERRLSLSEQIEGVRAVSEDGNSYLLHSFRKQLNYRLRPSYVKIRTEKNRIHKLRRARMTREGAIRLLEQVKGPRDTWHDEPKVSGYFKVLDD
jgi:hypothetical protein